MPVSKPNNCAQILGWTAIAAGRRSYDFVGAASRRDYFGLLLGTVLLIGLTQGEWMISSGFRSDLWEHAGENLQAKVLLVS